MTAKLVRPAVLSLCTRTRAAGMKLAHWSSEEVRCRSRISAAEAKPRNSTTEQRVLTASGTIVKCAPCRRARHAAGQTDGSHCRALAPRQMPCARSRGVSQIHNLFHHRSLGDSQRGPRVGACRTGQRRSLSLLAAPCNIAAVRSRLGARWCCKQPSSGLRRRSQSRGGRRLWAASARAAHRQLHQSLSNTLPQIKKVETPSRRSKLRALLVR